jgi:hypothetical protein
MMPPPSAVMTARTTTPTMSRFSTCHVHVHGRERAVQPEHERAGEVEGQLQRGACGQAPLLRRVGCRRSEPGQRRGHHGLDSRASNGTLQMCHGTRSSCLVWSATSPAASRAYRKAGCSEVHGESQPLGEGLGTKGRLKNNFRLLSARLSM